MSPTPLLRDITIRTELQPGDLGSIAFLHGQVYSSEFGYTREFDFYVMSGLLEVHQLYDPEKSRVWMVEHEGHVVGSLILLGREGVAQLRYFILDNEYRSLGLGKLLMDQFMAALSELQYDKAYLWTESELPAAISLYKRYGFTLTEEKQSTTFGKLVTEQRFDWLRATVTSTPKGA